MNFVIDLSVLKNQKKDIYNLILVIVNKLFKMFYYKQVKTMINIAKLANIDINHHSFSNSIISYKSALSSSIF